MMVVTSDTIMIAALVLLIITTAMYIGLVVALYIKGDLKLFIGITIITALVLICTWLMALSVPCTGYQMIQIGSNPITPEMCKRISF